MAKGFWRTIPAALLTLATLASLNGRAIEGDSVAASSKVPMLPEVDRLDLIPGSERITSSSSLGSNRIVRRDGIWIVIFDGTDGQLWMSFARAERPEGRDFRRALPVVGEKGAAIQSEDAAKRGNLLVDSAGQLHLFWQEKGLRHAACRSGCFSDPENLTAPRSWEVTTVEPEISELGDVVLDSSGGFWITYTQGDSVFAGHLREGRWQPQRIDEGKRPSAFFEPGNSLHLVFERNKRIRYVKYDTSAGRALESEDVAYGLVFHPHVVVVQGRPLIVYQGKGVKQINRPTIDPASGRDAEFIPLRTEILTGSYNEQREGAGASIVFAVRGDRGWRRGYVARAEEIPLRLAGLNDTNAGDIRPMVEEMWHPVLSLDRHGVPWVFWSNTTRLHTYFARWLGEGFSDPLECRGPLYGLSWAVNVERHSPAGAVELGVLTVAARRLYFGRVPVPPLPERDARTFPVLDLLNFTEVVGLTHHLNRFEPDSGNPLIGGPERPESERGRFPNVRLDGNRLWMEFYRPDAPPTSEPAPAETGQDDYTAAVGRWGFRRWVTTSDDGIHWSPAQKGVLRYRAPGMPPGDYWITYFLDKFETDPSRRFKGILGEGHWINNDERWVVYSADGIHWSGTERATGAEFMKEQGGPSYRDPYDIPERRFKSITRSLGIHGSRALGIMYSMDAVHWQGAEPRLTPEFPYAGPRTTPIFWRGRLSPRLILDSLGERNGEQVYWGTVWIENGIYLCLYAPMPYDGGYEVALAASRDGLHFYRIKNGTRVLSRGPEGDWDNGAITATSPPIRRGEEHWFYYGGTARHHGVEAYEVDHSGIGLARMRADGWAYLQPNSPSVGEGNATSIPFEKEFLEGKQLFLNVSGVAPGRGRVLVELLDAETGAPLEGYGLADGLPVISEGVEVPVRWKRKSHLESGAARRIQIRLRLEGPFARLYAFTIR